MDKIEKLYFDAELPLPEDKEERCNEYVIFEAGYKSCDEEIKKLEKGYHLDKHTIKEYGVENKKLRDALEEMLRTNLYIDKFRIMKKIKDGE